MHMGVAETLKLLQYILHKIFTAHRALCLIGYINFGANVLFVSKIIMYKFKTNYVLNTYF